MSTDTQNSRVSSAPRSAANCFSASTLMSTATTLAPSSTKRRQISRPMPPAAPVTSATRFFRPLIALLLVSGLGSCALGPVAKLELLDLSRGSPLDRTEDEFPRELEFGHSLTAELQHLVGRHLAVVPSLEFDEHARRLAPPLVLHRHRRRVGYRGMLKHDFLDFDRRDVFAAGATAIIG